MEVLHVKQEWLESRLKGIGGSEVAAVLGIDPYKTAYSVWLEKTTGVKEEVNNAYTRSGQKLEKVVVEYFAEETGYSVIFQEDGVFDHIVHPQYDYMRGTRDRVYITPDGTKCILECKTTQKDIDKDNLPMNWYCQLQWYMGLYGMKKGAVAWLQRGIKFDYVEIDFDEAFFNYLVENVKDFWENYVIPCVEPPLKSVSDVVTKFPSHEDGKVMEATQELFHVYERLNEIRDKIKDLEEEEDNLLEQFKMVMRDAEKCVYGGITLATWKSGKKSLSFDSKKFESEHPDLYDKYVVSKEAVRRFLIK